ncbi:DUF3024 domain-containing protein [Denitromonas sp.]|nr:DUF3024 domain-containing protein [Denitromonas sp.]
MNSRYDPHPTVRTIDEVLSIVDADEYGGFRG